jgi:biopolymer transport protein ExbB/TolQ
VSAAPGSAAGKFQKEIEMKESVRDRWTLWKPFLWSVPLTIVWFLLIFGLKKLAGGNPAVDYIYLFFYRAGQFLIQFVTTYLFGVGLVFLVESWRQLGPEQEMADKADKAMAAVADESGESVISCTVATQMADDIPLEFRRKIGVRRIYELLHGYASGEEPITLNEELSRRDLEQIERGHLLLNAMKQLIPVLGFLGTVVGLSMGMTKFPQAAAQADSVDKLRMILRDFASSLSVAFDTTLLALVYAIVLVILATILTQQEEAFIARVDEIARGLMTRFRAAVGRGGAGAGIVTADITEALDRWWPKLDAAYSGAVERLERGIAGPVDRLSQVVEATSQQQTAEITRRLDSLAQVAEVSTQRQTADLTQRLDRLAQVVEVSAQRQTVEITPRLDRLAQVVDAAMQRQTAELTRRLDGLEERVSRMPRYQILVRPAPDEEHGQG